MVDVLPRAAVIHAIDGRTRVRIADRRGDAAFFASVATVLSRMAGVKRAEVTPLTCGVLILHDGPLSRIGEAAEKARLFSLVGNGTPQHSSESSTLRIDLRTVAVAGLGLIAAWQLYKEKVLPPAVTAVWYAARLAGLALIKDSWGGGE